MIKLSDLVKEQGNKVEGYVVEIREHNRNEETGLCETVVRYKIELNDKRYDSVEDEIEVDRVCLGEEIRNEVYSDFQRCYYELLSVEDGEKFNNVIDEMVEEMLNDELVVENEDTNIFNDEFVVLNRVTGEVVTEFNHKHNINNVVKTNYKLDDEIKEFDLNFDFYDDIVKIGDLRVSREIYESYLNEYVVFYQKEWLRNEDVEKIKEIISTPLTYRDILTVQLLKQYNSFLDSNDWEIITNIPYEPMTNDLITIKDKIYIKILKNDVSVYGISSWDYFIGLIM